MVIYGDLCTATSYIVPILGTSEISLGFRQALHSGAVSVAEVALEGTLAAAKQAQQIAEDLGLDGEVPPGISTQYHMVLALESIVLFYIII